MVEATTFLGSFPFSVVSLRNKVPSSSSFSKCEFILKGCNPKGPRNVAWCCIPKRGQGLISKESKTRAC